MKNRDFLVLTGRVFARRIETVINERVSIMNRVIDRREADA
jgi:hypothetical protein